MKNSFPRYICFSYVSPELIGKAKLGTGVVDHNREPCELRARRIKFQRPSIGVVDSCFFFSAEKRVFVITRRKQIASDANAIVHVNAFPGRVFRVTEEGSSPVKAGRK